MKKFLNEFKAFALKGNVIDMAVGVIIATAFGKITSSLVADVFMPVLGLITGGVNISGAFYALDGQAYASIEAAKEAGVATLNYGTFLQNVIDFILIALCVFVFVKVLNCLRRRKSPRPLRLRRSRVCARSARRRFTTKRPAARTARPNSSNQATKKWERPKGRSFCMAEFG